ncbi:MAG: bifunctional homocysteine S-methyltransferase/methylenetetrahydrofolate reductase [Planctomycetes bacterium]|nr:bifunctional homocysteine S-methyltransferase/methylenetetrahydrofolate reductase [Planctomycetota bacterium]
MQPFLEALAERVLVFDGAMGTMLFAKGTFLNQCFDELNVSAPATVRTIHDDYIRAGADVIETNTFGANRMKLGKFGLADRVVDLNRAGAALARQAAGDRVWVAGSMGPLGVPIEPLGKLAYEEVEGLFAEQAEALAEAGVDLFSLETFISQSELQHALRAVKRCGLPVAAQFVVAEDGRTPRGTDPAEVIRLLLDEGANLVGFNCGVGPRVDFEAAERLGELGRGKLIVQPNAGRPSIVEGRVFYLSSPEYFATYALRFLELGARALGGCCGTTPEHIKRIKGAVRSRRPADTPPPPAITVDDAPTVPVVAMGQKSRLSSSIDRGGFPVSIEMAPPRGCDPEKMIEAARAIHRAGIDHVNIPDGPRASARMGSAMLALVLIQHTNIEPILHYCCRDRNILGMQSDLMGLYAAGLKNLLCVTGDPPRIGDYPDATPVYDVDSIGLTNIVRGLNQGRDVGRNAIGKPTGYFLGVGANPEALDLEREIRRFEWKVDAGAEFAITQPVFNPDALLRFLDRIEPVRIPVLAGIWPLASYRNAEFMRNEVPGCVVPDEVMERMRRATTREEARAEGIRIAQESLVRVIDRIQGVQVSAPFGNYQTAFEVVSVLGNGLGMRRKTPGAPG